jgi:O-succinylhomoserine sulfhydrylase
VLAKGLETLSVRMLRHSENALAVARWLEARPEVARVRYPWLESHPQHALARSQQRAGGAVLAFDLKGADDAARKAAAWRVVDGCRLLSITANLGDVKSTITHPASTTHGRMPLEARREAGIGEGMLRVAVGLEDPQDICADLARGLAA